MVEAFPPTTAHREQVEELASVFATVTLERHAVYVSTPITSGRRHWEWHARQERNLAGPPDELFKQAIEKNRVDAARFVARVRNETSRTVIDPAAFADVPGWRQSDYHAFWGEVIAKYVREIIFRDGWQYSRGCSYEFLVATSERLLMRDERRAPLTRQTGRELIRTAAEETAHRGASAEFLIKIVEALEDLGPETLR